MDSKDRLRCEGDKMFIPINIDGGFNDNFNVFSGGRLYSLLGVIIGYFVVLFLMVSAYISLGGIILISIGYWVLGQWLIRKFVIREKYYYEIISKMKEYERTTPAVFWGISNIVGDTDGAVLQYTDGKVGVIVRLNKNIITGKNASAKDIHYNSVSDFYNNLVVKGYKFVLFNKMETLGKDTRLQELDKLVYKVDNENLRKLMELQVKYLKVNARETLYETDYVLVYTDKVLKMDSILEDVRDSLEILTSGSNYSTYDIMDKVGVVDLVNIEYGTNRFDYIEATMSVFKNGSYRGLQGTPLVITDIEFESGEIISLSEIEFKRLRNVVQDYKASEDKVYKDIFEVIKRDKVSEDISNDIEIDIEDGEILGYDGEYVGEVEEESEGEEIVFEDGVEIDFESEDDYIDLD